MSRQKTLKFVNIRCPECDYLNLVPVITTLSVKETMKCENCGKVIATRAANYNY